MPTPPTSRIIALEPVFIKAAGTVVITAAANHDITLSALRLTPVTSDNHTVTVYKYDTGGAGKASERVILGPNFTIPAGGGPFELGPITLPAGYAIEVEADQDDVFTAEPNGYDQDHT